MLAEATHLIAILLALLAALVNACSHLFVRMGTNSGKAKDAVVIVMSMNVVVLLPIVGAVYYPNYGLTYWSWLSFAAAGTLGTLFGRLFQYTSIARIGASRTAPIVASNALVATILGVIFLDESLTTIHAVGIVFVVFGVVVIAWETGQGSSGDLSRRQLLLGPLIPLGAALAYGWEPIFANYGFAEGTPAPVGLVVKTVAAMLGFTVYLYWHQAVPNLRALNIGGLRWFALGGIANTLFLLGYYFALELAPVNIVVPIITTYTLFVILLSAAFMPQRLEHVTWRIGGAAVTVFVGILLIARFG